jgi:hypothetical protein
LSPAGPPREKRGRLLHFLKRRRDTTNDKELASSVVDACHGLGIRAGAKLVRVAKLGAGVGADQEEMFRYFLKGLREEMEQDELRVLDDANEQQQRDEIAAIARAEVEALQQR